MPERTGMPRTKLTQREIKKLKAPDPSGKQVLHWDTKVRGFGVLCSGVTNAKTFVVQRDLPGGRTRRVTIAPVNVLSLDKARKRAEGVLADFYKGIDPKGGTRGNATLRESLARYQTARKDLSDKSKEDYNSSFERYLAKWLDRPLRTITREMVEDRHREIAAEVQERHRSAAAEAAGRHREKAIRTEKAGWPEAAARHRASAAAADARKAAPGHATANGVMRTLRAMWNFCAEGATDMPPNPVKLHRQQWFKVPKRERLVKADQLPAFYRAVTELPNEVARDYLLLMLFTGLRRGEAARLTWDDVDLKGRVIRIPAHSTKSGHKLDLPMTDFVRDLLVARRAKGDAKFVFPSNSESGHIEEPKFPLQLVADASGISVSAHDLRRTYMTVAESTNIAFLALKALVNHSLGRDVTSGYVQMTPERLREPAQQVCDKMKELCAVAAPAGANVTKL
jgi:integrase